MKKEKKDPYVSLKYKDFKFFLATKILLTMAIQFQSVSVGWHVYSLTHDPLSLGLIGLVEILPNFSVTLFAGQIIEPLEDCLKIQNLSLFLNSINFSPQDAETGHSN